MLKILPWLFSALLFTGCTEVRLIGAYDERVDAGIQSATEKLSSVYVKLNKYIEKKKTGRMPGLKEPILR